MPVIRIPETAWGKVWRFLVKTGPISRISQEPLYAVSDRQIRLLKKKKLPFSVVSSPNGSLKDSRDG